MFRGSMVALVTPFKKDAVDVERLRELVEFHINAGTHALVAAGTTGESGTLNHEEKHLVIKTVIEQAEERIPVIAGTFANATRDCIALTEEALELGADAALIMTPAYIKPTQEGLYAHYSKIAQTVPLPIILYNIPSRTQCDLLPDTVVKLANISNIIGIKEGTGKRERLDQLLAQCGESLDVYSGDDPTCAEWMLHGAKGVISVTANVAPKAMAKLCDLAFDRDEAACLDLNNTLQPLNHTLFKEINPIPVKWALARMGLIEEEIRMPLLPLSMAYRAELEQALQILQLI